MTHYDDLGIRGAISSRRVLSTVSHLALLFTPLGLAPAAAQEAPANATAQPREEVVSTEILVTARRKEESLTEVPASITAYSADFLKKQNIQSFTDYATKIPNLTFQYGQGTDFSSVGFVGGRQTTVRGVAGANTTAYYINDTPVPASISPQVLNLDRIEVLKGPQGTLFGASSMGGNLRFITREPSFADNSYTAQVQGGSTKGGGFDFDGNARADIVLVPDRVSLNVAGGYLRESGFITRAFPDGSGNLTYKDGEGRNNAYSASAALRIKLTDSLEATLSGIGQISDLKGFPAAYVPLPAYKPVSYTLIRERDVQEYSKDKWGLGSLVLKYSGDGFSVVSSTSFFARRTKELEDSTEGNNDFIEDCTPTDDGGTVGLCTNAGRPALPTINIAKDRRFTSENRVSFDEGTLLPHLSGIVGVFHQHRFNSFYQPPILVPELGAAGLDPSYVTNQIYPTHENNTAIFGELYYEVVPKLTVTVGLRKYWITQKADSTFAQGIFGPPGGSFYPARSTKQNGVVPKFVISYALPNNGTIYASAAKGFRVGGSQGRLPDNCQGDLAAINRTQDDTLQYKSDTLWSYEIGAKGQFANRRINVSTAAFQIDWSNIQQQVGLPVCTFSFISNAGKARIRGAEMDISGRPIADVPLSIQLGLGYTDAILRDPGLIQQAPNTRLTQVPKWTASISGNYEYPVTDSVSLIASADYSYTSSVKLVNTAGGFLTRQPFNIVNATLGVSFGKSQLLIYGKNLLDKHLNLGDLYSSGFERTEDLGGGNTQRLPRAAVSRPRQIGVQYRVNF
ncbi:MAG: TonB-dependent receptor [Sphingobium sp.]